MKFLPEYIDLSWNDFINRKDILDELNKIYEQIGHNYFPAEENVLRFLKLDLNNLKCIIVGMEPYPTAYLKDGIEIPMATGRSFEVSILNGQDWNYKIKQSSLRNILKTIYFNETGQIKSLEDIRNEINKHDFKILNPHDLFDNLEQQGVLFLNATLTVEKQNVDSHRKIWEYFMNELIKYIIDKNKNIKWLLWGDKAKTRILPFIDENNAIISQHPRLSGFVNENCFKSITTINWTGI